MTRPMTHATTDAMKQRSERRRRGLAVVEFAVIAPLLVFLTLGAIELARGLMVKAVLSDAARKGCRTAVLPVGPSSGTNAAIQSDINAVLNANSITSSYATVTILVNGKAVDASTAQIGDQISVKLSVPVSRVAWITPLFLPASAIESDTLIMMRQ
jgi:Flp pilus assembly protein TadG